MICLSARNESNSSTEEPVSRGLLHQMGAVLLAQQTCGGDRQPGLVEFRLALSQSPHGVAFYGFSETSAG